MPSTHTIALDGPAGCGKSTLGNRLARELGYFFLDSGVLYRAITRHAMNVGVKIYQPDSVAAYAETLTIEVEQLQPTFRFQINGAKVRKLNTLQMDKVVPTIAAYRCIRECVRRVQRQIATQGDVILAGRDIGTVVLPHADLKIYLDVSLEERASRRFANQNTEGRTLDEVKQDLLLRDLADATRHESPMQVADDAIILTTDGMTVDEVLAQVRDYIERV